MKKLVWFVVITMLMVAGCSTPEANMQPGFVPTVTRPSGTTWNVTASIPPPADLQVYFSDPSKGPNGQYHNGPDEVLANAIQSARISVDMAIYSINLWSIRDALVDAHHRGVKVRLVMESENLDDDVPQELKLAGIPIIGDRREGLMHNKFVIIDGEDVWTGSMNFTIGSTYFDNNNMVHIHSQEVAEDYSKEFNEMFVNDMFGADVVSETPHPQVLVGSTMVEIYFSPDDHVEKEIVNLIGSARQDIHFMVFSLTLDDIGAELIAKSKSGVTVEGIMDDSQVTSNTGSEFEKLTASGIKVTRRGVGALMHHKVIIIDHSIVITGSYNFSTSAENHNDENVIVIHDTSIANMFLDEYNRVIAQRSP